MPVRLNGRGNVQDPAASQLERYGLWIGKHRVDRSIHLRVRDLLRFRKVGDDQGGSHGWPYRERAAVVEAASEVRVAGLTLPDPGCTNLV
jgi:hypothetical protein